MCQNPYGTIRNHTGPCKTIRDYTGVLVSKSVTEQISNSVAHTAKDGLGGGGAPCDGDDGPV